jgi:PQQ-dependent dehydrogenase (methanol/ethanol family)
MRRALGAVAASLLGLSCVAYSGVLRPVDDGRLVAAEAEPGSWLSYGRTYDEQHYSPLDAIDEGNVSGLGLAWYQDIDVGRGIEATPIVADGVIYLSTGWSTVRAYDARTGKLLWAYDPQVPRDTLVKACCDAVNRGVAIWQGKVFVGALDGRLIAVDAKTGRPVWSTQTVDASQPYTITGAPRVVKGKVLIGNAGAEMGVRGYVSAYDAATGKLAWRFYTVPGDPAKPQESAALEMARKTWQGDVWWQRGGGGTAWDAIAYDPKLDLVFIGTGNGSPWNQALRSPGGGDNLFLSSIVAVRPDTGEYVWHYQETPGETWDYTSTQPIMLADLPIDGARRRVILHAPKNGFFYVIDAGTGKLISAENFVPVNWASGIDLKTGRPIANPAARYDVTGKAVVVTPGSRGGHNWMPMSYSPKTGLVYIPAQETAEVFSPDPAFRMKRNAYNTGDDLFGLTAAANDPALKVPPSKGYLLAWDSVKQREVWRVPHANFGNGGTLATAGNLVVQGDGHGQLAIYRASDGRTLWQTDVQSMAMGGPVAYALDGVEYIAVATGCGGDYAGACGLLTAKGKSGPIGRLLVFKLGGTAKLPPPPEPVPVILNPPPATAPATAVAAGRQLYGDYCEICHGGGAVSRGLNPDLRASPFLHSDAFFDVVLGGALKDNGMASFAGAIDRKEAEAIRAYVIARANADKAKGH